MREDEKFIKSFDGELIYAKEYTVEHPKATVIISTDVKEYANLYDDFSKKLASFGFNVFTYDLRAHKNSAKEPFGTYSENFYNDCVRDLIFLNRYLSKKYGVKMANIGVGVGGEFVVRAMQFLNIESTNFIVGTHFEKLNIRNFTLELITKLTLIFFNKNSEIKWLNKLNNSKLEKKFAYGAYLSTNKDYIEKTKNDKFCNFNLSANILNSIYNGSMHTFKHKNLMKLKNKKFYILSGEYDVVTNFGRNTKKLAERLKKLNIQTEEAIFNNLRHNLLNESSNAFLDYVLNILNSVDDKKINIEGENQNDIRTN